MIRRARRDSREARGMRKGRRERIEKGSRERIEKRERDKDNLKIEFSRSGPAICFFRVRQVRTQASKFVFYKLIECIIIKYVMV